MRDSLICFILLLAVLSAQAQGKDEAIFFSSKDQVSRFHTISDLEDLKKGDLIKLYQERVSEILTVLPFISLANEPDVRLQDVGIKEDSGHLKTLKKKKDATQNNLENTTLAIEELVPYADTEKIIWTILYYEEIIKKMRLGTQGGY